MITIKQLEEISKLISANKPEPYVIGVGVPTPIYEILVKSDKLKFTYIYDNAYIEFDNGNNLSIIHNPLLDNDYILLKYSDGNIETKKIQFN